MKFFFVILFLVFLFFGLETVVDMLRIFLGLIIAFFVGLGMLKGIIFIVILGIIIFIFNT